MISKWWAKSKKRVAWLAVLVLASGVFIVFFAFSAIAGRSIVFDEVYGSSGLGQGMLSTGVSWADFDDDNDLDLFVAGRPIRLYRNNGDETFTEVTREAGLGRVFAGAAGVFGDYDNDGCRDLFVNVVSRSEEISDRLFRNNCDGTFADVTAASGLTGLFGSLNYASAAWADYDNDGHLDLYVAHYGTFKNPDERIMTHESNILYRNNRDGTFTDVAARAGVSGVTDCIRPRYAAPHIEGIVGGPLKLSYQPVWFDFNDDGHIDLFVATDFGVSPLYRNSGDGTFTEVTKEAGLCRYASNMGVDVGDYDNSGTFDLYITNVGANYLWANQGDGTFFDVAKDVAASDPLSIGWGASFLDFDNDGALDIFVGNGIVVRTDVIGVAEVGKSTLDKLYWNAGDGAFVEKSRELGIDEDYFTEGLAVGDYNNDGFVDIAAVSGVRTEVEKNRLYKNSRNGNSWLTVKLIGTRSNRDGVGAKITVKTKDRTQIELVQAGNSYLSQNSSWPTFGLGKERRVDEVRIEWPSGTVKTLQNVNANQFLTIRE